MRSLGIALFTAGCMVSCTTEAWYESGKRNAELKCQGLPQAAYEECMSRINQKSYQEYKKERPGGSPSQP